MDLADRDLHVYGVQFHPEFILTQHGKQMLKNFLEM
jgi:anthranilate/para-aminobenzoate synthase component II